MHSENMVAHPAVFALCLFTYCRPVPPPVCQNLLNLLEIPQKGENTPMAQKRGLLLVMTGASGVGKGTIRQELEKREDYHYSISWTTRLSRPGEENGVHYFFKTPEEFETEIHAGMGFLEHAEFVGNQYGTPRAAVEEALSRGRNVLLEIEVQGAMQVKKAMQEAILIFVMPPSLTELKNRLVGRATEPMEKIEKRLAKARGEILMAHEFKYCVLNDDVTRAVEDIQAIIRAEKLNSLQITQQELDTIVQH